MAVRGPVEAADEEDPRFRMSSGSSCHEFEKAPP